MSERGSFVTEYIYCNKCLEAAKKVLLGGGKFLFGVQIPHYDASEETTLPILAGKIGGLYPGEELVTFEEEIAPKLAELICCTMRIAVIAEKGQMVYEVSPESADDQEQLKESQ